MHRLMLAASYNKMFARYCLLVLLLLLLLNTQKRNMANLVFRLKRMNQNAVDYYYLFIDSIFDFIVD